MKYSINNYYAGYDSMPVACCAVKRGGKNKTLVAV